MSFVPGSTTWKAQTFSGRVERSGWHRLALAHGQVGGATPPRGRRSWGRRRASPAAGRSTADALLGRPEGAAAASAAGGEDKAAEQFCANARSRRFQPGLQKGRGRTAVYSSQRYADCSRT